MHLSEYPTEQVKVESFISLIEDSQFAIIEDSKISYTSLSGTQGDYSFQVFDREYPIEWRFGYGI